MNLDKLNNLNHAFFSREQSMMSLVYIFKIVLCQNLTKICAKENIVFSKGFLSFFEKGRKEMRAKR